VDAVQGVLWTNNAAGEMAGEQPGWTDLTGQTRSEYQASAGRRPCIPKTRSPPSRLERRGGGAAALRVRTPGALP